MDGWTELKVKRDCGSLVSLGATWCGSLTAAQAHMFSPIWGVQESHTSRSRQCVETSTLEVGSLMPSVIWLATTRACQICSSVRDWFILYHPQSLSTTFAKL
nr:uncharacterized protein LOC128687228 [Cherax quadricarinatus]